MKLIINIFVYMKEAFNCFYFKSIEKNLNLKVNFCRNFYLCLKTCDTSLIFLTLIVFDSLKTFKLNKFKQKLNLYLLLR